MKLIKINTDHYIIVDDSEIKEGDWYYWEVTKTIQIAKLDSLNRLPKSSDGSKKITHSTQPLNTKFNDWFDAQIITLSEVKELIGEVDVEKKAHNWFMTEKFMSSHIADMKSFIAGYNQALEDNKDKKYTEEDLRKAISETRRGMLFLDKYVNEFIQSLQPKTKWEVEFDENGKLKLV